MILRSGFAIGSAIGCAPHVVAWLLQFSFLQADDLEFWAGEGDDNGTSTTGRRWRRRLNYGLGPDAHAQGRHPQTNGEGPRSNTSLGDDTTEGGRVGVTRHKGLDKVLLKDFSELPKKVDYGDYGVVNVSPSIVPAYFPSFRVFNYNISAEAVQEAIERRERRRRGEIFGKKPPHGHRKPDPSKPRKDQCKKKEYRDSWRCHFSKDDWHSDPEAPSRKNGLMSPLGYAQVSLGLLIILWRFRLLGTHHLPGHSLRMWCLRLSFAFRRCRPSALPMAHVF